MKTPFDDYTGKVLTPRGNVYFQNGILNKKRNKYNAQKTTIDGVTFDSKKEGARFFELKLLQDRKEITDLQRQVKFQIVPKAGNNNRARYYVADFTYKEYGKQIIEDVKSPATRKNAVYSLKKALVLWQYPEYEFRET